MSQCSDIAVVEYKDGEDDVISAYNKSKFIAMEGKKASGSDDYIGFSVFDGYSTNWKIPNQGMEAWKTSVGS